MSHRNSDGPANGQRKRSTGVTTHGTSTTQFQSNHSTGIPFRDAEPNTNETPLDWVDFFVVPANDEEGHSERAQFRMTPYLMRLCKLIVHSTRFPYLDIQDLIRHAVTRHCSWIMGLRLSLPQHPRITMAGLEEVVKESEWRIRTDELLQKMLDISQHHLGRGELGEVMRLVALIQARLSHGDQNARSRELREKVDRYFAHYLMPGGPLHQLPAPRTGPPDSDSGNGGGGGGDDDDGTVQ